MSHSADNMRDLSNWNLTQDWAGFKCTCTGPFSSHWRGVETGGTGTGCETLVVVFTAVVEMPRAAKGLNLSAGGVLTWVAVAVCRGLKFK